MYGRIPVNTSGLAKLALYEYSRYRRGLSTIPAGIRRRSRVREIGTRRDDIEELRRGKSRKNRKGQINGRIKRINDGRTNDYFNKLLKEVND